MNGRFLLDTNIVIQLFKGDSIIVDKIENASELYLPAISLGELYYGAFNSSKKEQNLNRIDAFKPTVSILCADDTTALFYGQIKKYLKEKGRPIPENDIWIAAISQQYELPLITRDKHFSHIEGLNIKDWNL